jgi:hypothetical protein
MQHFGAAITFFPPRGEKSLYGAGRGRDSDAVPSLYLIPLEESTRWALKGQLGETMNNEDR